MGVYGGRRREVRPLRRVMHLLLPVCVMLSTLPKGGPEAHGRE